MNIDEKLLQKYIEGTISEDELPSVIAWLDESPEHVREFRSLHRMYQITLMNSPLHKETKEKKFKRIEMKSVIREVVKIAAIFLVFLGGSKIYDKLNPAILTEEDVEYQSQFVPAGQRAELTLPDRTKVWLNAQSTLRYPIKFGRGDRKVELDGEAFFKVEKNTEKPFIVDTKNIDVKVLGTEFNVKSYRNKKIAEVALLEGKVELTSESNSKSIEVAPGENIYCEGGSFVRGKIRDMNYFRWREGLICFENESVGDIFGKLELYYDINVKIDNKSLLKESYSGKFRTKDGVEQVLKVLQKDHKFKYTIDKDNNLLTIK